MLYEEIQFEEKAVQLIPEDFETLSEYSWDMTGYTSRFGFFYLGNEKADVEGLTRWQAEHIFQLTPTPPGMEDAFPDIEKGQHIGKEKEKEIVKRNEAVGDTYIAQAVQEKNLRYLSFFLQAYESRINAKVYFFLRRNGMDTYDPSQFLDMKLACQEVILKKLPTFDPSKGAKFLTYMYQFIEDALISFRMRQESWTIDSLDIYKGIRRMAAIYNATSCDTPKAIEKFCKETGCQPKTAVEYLERAIGIRARQTEVIIDRDEDDEAIIEDVIPDSMGDLCYEISKQWLAQAVRDSFSKLSWRDQTMIKVRNAICWNCGGMQPMAERYSYKDISVQLMNGSSDGGAEKAYNAALARFTAQLIEDRVIRVVDLKLEKLTRRKKIIAAAIYRYQADCDGEWGEIQFAFEKRNAKIVQLADWDTSRTNLYAKRVIDRILRTGGNDLPQKERIVFER
jgi:hypothetical protein